MQGNLLDGPQVVDAMAAAYDPAQPHVGRRLLQCLQAGEAAGGDRRGLESAALSIWQEGAAYGGGLDIGTETPARVVRDGGVLEVSVVPAALEL